MKRYRGKLIVICILYYFLVSFVVTAAEPISNDQIMLDMTKRIAANSGDTDAYFRRAIAYVALGQNDLVIADLSKVVEINQEYTEAYYCRGITYEVQGQTDLAFSDFNKTIEINPKFAEAYVSRCTHLFWQKTG